MLHTLWTRSLFCVWGWIVQEEPLPALPQRWHCWSHQVRVKGLGAHPDGTSPAQGSCQLRLESSWVCAEESNLWGTARTHSQTEFCTCGLLNTHRLIPPQDFLVHRCELMPQRTGRKVGIDTLLSYGLLLGGVLVLLWWYSWVLCWSQHDQLVWETQIWETIQAFILNNLIKRLFIGVL